MKVRKGFTLIELLMVIGLIGVLSTIVVVTINPAAMFARARDATRKKDLLSIQAALELYRSDEGVYKAQVGGANRLNTTDCPPASSSLTSTTGTVTYIKTIPCDPRSTTVYNSGNYFYTLSSGNYTLAVCIHCITRTPVPYLY